jgi:hypothetical protein
MPSGSVIGGNHTPFFLLRSLWVCFEPLLLLASAGVRFVCDVVEWTSWLESIVNAQGQKSGANLTGNGSTRFHGVHENQ